MFLLKRLIWLPKFWNNDTHFCFHVYQTHNYNAIFMHSGFWSFIIYRSLPEHMYLLFYWNFWFILHVYSIIHKNMYFATGTEYFNLSGDRCSLQGQGMIGPLLTWGPVRNTLGSFPMALGCLVSLLLICIYYICLCHSYIIEKSDTCYFCHYQRKHYIWEFFADSPFSDVSL